MQKEDKKSITFLTKKPSLKLQHMREKVNKQWKGTLVYLLGRWGERLCVCGHGHADVCSTHGQADHNTVLGKHALCERVCLYV